MEVSRIRHHPPKICYVNHVNKVAPFSGILRTSNLECKKNDARSIRKGLLCSLTSVVPLIGKQKLKKCPKLGPLTLASVHSTATRLFIVSRGARARPSKHAHGTWSWDSPTICRHKYVTEVRHLRGPPMHDPGLIITAISLSSNMCQSL